MRRRGSVVTRTPPVEDPGTLLIRRRQNESEMSVMAAKKQTAKPVDDMLYGGLWCVGGLVATVVSYQMASEGTGGTYFVFWGAVIFGGAQFFRGLFALGRSSQVPEQYLEQSQHDPLVCKLCGTTPTEGSRQCPGCGCEGLLVRSIWERRQQGRTVAADTEPTPKVA